MDFGQLGKKPRDGWFIGVEVYSQQGRQIWIARGPFDHPEGLHRACAELRSIDKRITEPFQAPNIKQAQKTCHALGLVKQVLQKPAP